MSHEKLLSASADLETVLSPISIDVSHTGSAEEKAQILKDALQSLGLYKPDLLYTGVDGGRLETFHTIGASFNSSQTIFCSTENELFDGRFVTENAVAYAELYDIPAIIAYDGSQMESGKDSPHQEYRFKKGVDPRNALVSIFLLEY